MIKGGLSPLLATGLEIGKIKLFFDIFSYHKRNLDIPKPPPRRKHTDVLEDLLWTGA